LRHGAGRRKAIPSSAASAHAAGQFEKDETPTTALIAQITAVEAYSPRAAK
jgi:hypothetical protein